MRTNFKYLSFSLFLLGNATQADFSTCKNNFYKQVAPTYQNAILIEQTYPLCFHGFAVLYSGQSLTPLWSAEYLTRHRIEQADEIEREDSFHEESQLPKNIQAKLTHYLKSGYDRGHLAPNSDMANHNQQYDSFSLANIAPQSPYMNRTIWKQVESATRYLTKVYGKTYVLTGLVFKDEHKIDNAVSIPSHLYKVVYFPYTPTGEQAGVYYAPNDESGRVEIISLEELTRRTGVNAMPALSEQVKSVASDLPLPHESFNDSEATFIDTKRKKFIDNTTNIHQSESASSSWVWIGQWLVGVVDWLKNHLR